MYIEPSAHSFFPKIKAIVIAVKIMEKQLIKVSALVQFCLISSLCSKYLEAVVERCSVRKVFLEISQNSQEKTCARSYFLINLQATALLSCEFCEISKNTFLHRTPLVAASEYFVHNCKNCCICNKRR